MTTGILLRDAEIRLQDVAQGDLTPMESAIVAWLRGESIPQTLLDTLSTPLRTYDSVAIAAIAEAAGWAIEAARLEDGLRWLAAVSLERVGLPAPVTSDALAVIGLGLAARSREWFAEWHDRVLNLQNATTIPAWLIGGGQAARGLVAVCSPELSVALSERGICTSSEDDERNVLEAAVRGELPVDPFHAHVVLVALRWIRRKAPIALPGRATMSAVAEMLQALPRALQQWPWEEKGRTKNSLPRKWHVDNEYHVQALVWAVLSPVFPDLKREEYSPAVGPIQPRVDFGIPSLRLLIEVKFVRSRKKLKETVNEIAQDASNYFVAPRDYEHMLVLIWDNSCNGQEHDIVREGIRKFQRVVDAVVVSRPGHMSSQGRNREEEAQ